MATQTVVDRPFPDLDVLDASAHGEAVDPVDVVGSAEETLEELNDPLSPARGILLALGLSVPFWIGVVYWLLW